MQLNCSIFTAFRSNASLEKVQINASLLDASNCILLESFQLRNANVPKLVRGLLVDPGDMLQRGDAVLWLRR
jgi:hypothetical protein